MTPTRRFLAVALCVLAAAGPASANIAPPGWAFARHRCVLDPGRFAAGATGGGYRFFVTAVRLQPVEPGGQRLLESGRDLRCRRAAARGHRCRLGARGLAHRPRQLLGEERHAVGPGHDLGHRFGL